MNSQMIQKSKDELKERLEDGRNILVEIQGRGAFAKVFSRKPLRRKGKTQVRLNDFYRPVVGFRMNSAGQFIYTVADDEGSEQYKASI